jgi:cell division septal protein FtsQ
MGSVGARPRWLGKALLVGLVLVGVWWLLHSPVLAFRGVTVAGYEGRDAPQLQAALDAAAREASLLTVPRDRIVVAGTPPKPGRRLAAATMPALEFARELDPSVGERIRALRVAPNGRIEGRLKGSGLLIVGSGERPRARAAALAAVLNNLSLDDQAAATYIDITVPDRPAVGFAPYTSVSSQR